MVLESCSFDTDRLTVAEWHVATTAVPGSCDLADVVSSLLTPTATRTLPPAWHGRFTRARAEEWVRARDDEGPTLLVTERGSAAVVGLLILFESASEDEPGSEVRLGYVLAETAWGRGLGSELIGGFVQWCRGRSELKSLVAGVSEDNPASARILKRNGFQPVAERVDQSDTERIFELRLR